MYFKRVPHDALGLPVFGRTKHYYEGLSNPELDKVKYRIKTMGIDEMENEFERLFQRCKDAAKDWDGFTCNLFYATINYEYLCYQLLLDDSQRIKWLRNVIPRLTIFLLS